MTTLYFNGKKLKQALVDTPKGRNKWYKEGAWILGQDQVLLLISKTFYSSFLTIYQYQEYFHSNDI